MRQRFQLEQTEWAELLKLSREAQTIPVLATDLTNAIKGQDSSNSAYGSVMSFWRKMGYKYGFNPDTAQPFDDRLRIITAEADNSEVETVSPSPSGYVQMLPDGTYDVLSPAGESLLGPFGGPFHTAQAAESVQRMLKAFDAINGTISEINRELRAQ